MLELKHITYTVSTPEGEQTILNDISIDIPDRKLIVFTGPNGGGKTTLAKAIMGLVTPTAARSSSTVRTSRTLASPSAQNSASATAFSSRRASRASRCATF